MLHHESFRLMCNWCSYNLVVTEGLIPWGREVMLSHCKRSHTDQTQEAISNGENNSRVTVPTEG